MSKLILFPILLSIVFGNDFKIYWNVPSEPCLKPFPLKPKSFKVITNSGQKFLGDKILTLYENVGLYPTISIQNGKVNNGGIPQRSNLSAHVHKIREDISKFIPDKKRFDGLAIIDYESWRPLWEQNHGERRVYIDASISWVKERHPTISDRFAKQVAEKEFNRAAKSFMLKTIKTVRKLLPNAKVGFYGFPLCDPYGGMISDRCSKPRRETNKKLHWLFQASSALFPSIYFKVQDADHNRRQRFVHARIMEALRVRKTLGLEVPIYLFTWFHYDYEHVYTNSDLCISTVFSAGYDIQGLILWSSSKNMTRRCEAIQNVFNGNVGPQLKKLTGHVEKCNEKLCSNNGRCVRKKLAPPFSCSFDAWTSKNYKCSCDDKFVGDNCEFDFTLK